VVGGKGQVAGGKAALGASYCSQQAGGSLKSPGRHGTEILGLPGPDRGCTNAPQLQSPLLQGSFGGGWHHAPTS
jgi:hypothetical protein